MMFIVQQYTYFGWENIKRFTELTRAIQSCEALRKKDIRKKTRVLNSLGERVYPVKKH